MSATILDIVSAPWTTVLTLASGYAAYFVAHTGLREHHQPVDQAFRVVLYGFWGMFAYMFARTYGGLGILSASTTCMAFAVVLGAFWRKWGRHAFTYAMRWSRLAMSDDIPTAWAALTDVGERVLLSQLKVTLCDGTMLFCSDLSQFSAEPNGPCVLGQKGDILMYVTDIRKADGDVAAVWSVAKDVADEHYGRVITYIPREQIARVALRRLGK